MLSCSFDHASQFFCLPANSLLLLSKNGSEVNVVYALLRSCLSNWHIQSLIIPRVSQLVVSHRERHGRINLHHMNTENQLFQHIGLSSNIFQPRMLAHYAAHQNQGETMLVVTNNNRETRWLNESKCLLKYPDAPPFFRLRQARLQCTINTRKSLNHFVRAP